MEEKKTSADWLKIVPDKYQLNIFEFNGWDKARFEYSFKQEFITKKLFKERVLNSAMSCKLFTNFINEW